MSSNTQTQKRSAPPQDPREQGPKPPFREPKQQVPGSSEQMQGVRVNAVAPGPVWDTLIPSTMPEKSVENFGKTSSMERPAQPADLAPMYVFLCSNESRYITGGIFDLTGGKMLP
jgi:enoyl-[acyl-carrier-protein] reductase (NADH)